MRTQQVVYGGDAGTPAEILAFNVVYRLPDAAKLFKAIYNRSNLAGKFYGVIGLYCLKDKEFETYKANYKAIKDTTGLYYRVGCFVTEHKNKDVVMDQWMAGFKTNVWYTKIVF